MNRLQNTAIIIAIVGLVIGSTLAIGNSVLAKHDNNKIKGATVVPGHHGCEVGSNGFIHSHGKCFHVNKVHVKENETENENETGDR